MAEKKVTTIDNSAGLLENVEKETVEVEIYPNTLDLMTSLSDLSHRIRELYQNDNHLSTAELLSLLTENDLHNLFRILKDFELLKAEFEGDKAVFFQSILIPVLSFFRKNATN